MPPRRRPVKSSEPAVQHHLHPNQFLESFLSYLEAEPSVTCEAGPGIRGSGSTHTLEDQRRIHPTEGEVVAHHSAHIRLPYLALHVVERRATRVDLAEIK